MHQKLFQYSQEYSKFTSNNGTKSTNSNGIQHNNNKVHQSSHQALKRKEISTVSIFNSLHQQKNSGTGRFLQDLRRYVVLRDEKENDPLKHKVRNEFKVHHLSLNVDECP